MAALPQPAVELLIGAVKTFGRFGPAYEVIGYAGRSEQGKDMVTICVLRTGETTTYEVDAMRQDSEAV